MKEKIKEGNERWSGKKNIYVLQVLNKQR